MSRDVSPITLPDKRVNGAAGASSKRLAVNQQRGERPNPQVNVTVSEDLVALIRLLIGGTTEATSQILARIRPPDTDGTPDDTALRHLVIGLVFEAQARTEMSLRTWQRRGRTLAQRLRDGLRQATDNPFLRPLAARIDQAFANVDAEVDRLIQRGKAEEAKGREQARDLADYVIDTLLDYLAHNPEVMQMIQRQSADFAGGILQETRDLTRASDQRLEQIARRLLGRPSREAAPPDFRLTDRTDES